MKASYRRQKTLGLRAQAIVEFAIVLPILLMVLFGILEVGRMLFIYAAVNNASREAVRYGSAVGVDTDPDDGYNYLKYSYCKGIRSIAKRSAYFLNLPDADIKISYDKGPSSAVVVSNCDAAAGEDSDVKNNISPGDRVIVEVSAKYTPLVKLVPIGQKTFTVDSARTIIGVFNLTSGTSSVPSSGGFGVPGGSGGSGGTSNTATFTATATPTATATATATATKTATLGPGNTPTFPPATATPTSTSTLDPFATQTPTSTNTPTSTFTPTSTSTSTPTATATAVLGCGKVTTSSISINKGSPTMSMTITNPHASMTVVSIQATWNHDAGGPGSKSLVLKQVALGSSIWIWASPGATGPSVTISPTGWTLPGNNATSTIVFTFDNSYQTRDTTEKIVLNLSSSECANFSIQNP